jgi:glucose/arabinose dehydrogenase
LSETVVAPQKDIIWGFSHSGTGSNAQLYFSTPNTHLVTLHLSSLKFHIDVIPSNQHSPRYVAFGPDGNLWYDAGGTNSLNVIGTDIFRILTVNPTSMTLTISQTQTATASQIQNPNSVFTAVSANPSVATVANGPTTGTFNITGQSAGSTTVRIADHQHNYVDIAVTVH